MSSQNKKILILGATGFIGRNLVNYFSDKSEYEVHAVHFQRPSYPTKKTVKWIQKDLRNPEGLNQLLSGFDIVIQAAATTSGAKEIVNTPSLHVTDNAVMNSYLFRAAVSEKVKHFIFFSCSVMYPQRPRPVRESDFSADEVYNKYFGVGWTKVYLEKMAEFFSKQGSTRFSVLRHSNIYGPYDKYDLEKSHVFGASITKVMTAKDQITVWGDGSEQRDFLYVDDLMSAVEKLIKHNILNYDLYNLGSETGTSVKSLVEKIIQLSEKKVAINFDTTKPSLPVNIVLNCERFKNDFQWRPETNLEQGIRKTLQWYKENIL